MANEGSTEVELQTADGVTLEAELRVPSARRGAVVLVHPHPIFGGSMHAGAVAELFAALPATGVSALRFNFRGVGSSEGSHDEGRGERLDVAAAVDTLSLFADDGPLVVVGWSFGADVSLCVVHTRIDAWVALAPPLRSVPFADMVAAGDHRPKVLVVPTHDQFNPPTTAGALTADWANTRLDILTGADHSLSGQGDRLLAICLETVDALA